MRGFSSLAVLGLLVVACNGSATDTSSTSRPAESPTSSTEPVATTTTVTNPTTSEASPTTNTSLMPSFSGDLPDGPCAIDEVPERGEPTVLVGDRLYGLGADLATPRCLLEGLSSSDIEWGPLTDRVRVGTSIYGAFPTLSFGDALDLEWTAPTGSRVVVVSDGEVVKVPVDGSASENIKFLDETEEVAYHPAGTHLLAVGTDQFGQYGLWFASNDGVNFILLAFDEDAVISQAAWSWLNEPLFTANHADGSWHVHRVELVDGSFQGPVVIETDHSIDRLMSSPFDPVMIGYRAEGEEGVGCVQGSTATVRGADLPEPLLGYTSTPVGWLSDERLLVLAYPEGCESEGELWVFTAGLCPGSTYGAELLMRGVDGAAARQAVPPAPPQPDFTGVIDPAPA